MGDNNLIIQPREPATTKSCKIEGMIKSNAIIEGSQNQQQANFEIINIKQVGKFPSTSKNEENKAKF